MPARELRDGCGELDLRFDARRHRRLDDAPHALLVVLQVGGCVLTLIEVPVRGADRDAALGDGFRLVRTVEREVQPAEVRVRERHRRVEAIGFQRFAERALVLPDVVQRDRQVVARSGIARIRLLPRLVGRDQRRAVSGHRQQPAVDVEPLALAGTVAQRVRAARVLRRCREVSEIELHDAQSRVRHREVGIDLHGALIVRDRLQLASLRSEEVPLRERLERVERRGRRLLDRRVELLDRLQRLAKPGANLRSGAAERRQHRLA